MHQDVNMSKHQKGLSMRISASWKHGAHALVYKFALMKENVHRGALLWLASGLLLR